MEFAVATHTKGGCLFVVVLDEGGDLVDQLFDTGEGAAADSLS